MARALAGHDKLPLCMDRLPYDRARDAIVFLGDSVDFFQRIASPSVFRHEDREKSPRRHLHDHGTRTQTLAA